jgi:hypothetical protein
MCFGNDHKVVRFVILGRADRTYGDTARVTFAKVDERVGEVERAHHFLVGGGGAPSEVFGNWDTYMIFPGALTVGRFVAVVAEGSTTIGTVYNGGIFSAIALDRALLSTTMACRFCCSMRHDINWHLIHRGRAESFAPHARVPSRTATFALSVRCQDPRIGVCNDVQTLLYLNGEENSETKMD